MAIKSDTIDSKYPDRVYLDLDRSYSQIVEAINYNKLPIINLSINDTNLKITFIYNAFSSNNMIVFNSCGKNIDGTNTLQSLTTYVLPNECYYTIDEIVSNTTFNNHTSDFSNHITEIERNKWNNKANTTDIYINGIDNGVIGDGETDDYEALQALINSVSSVPSINGKGTVYLPNRIYRINSTLNIGNGVHFICDGKIVYDGTGSAILCNGRYCNIKIGMIQASNGTAFEMSGGSENNNLVNIVEIDRIYYSHRGLYLHDEESTTALTTSYITVHNICGHYNTDEGSIGIEIFGDNKWISELHLNIGYIRDFLIGVYAHSAGTIRFHSLHIENIVTGGRGIKIEDCEYCYFENLRLNETYGNYAIDFVGKNTGNVFYLDTYVPEKVCIDNATFCDKNLIHCTSITAYSYHPAVTIICITGQENPCKVPYGHTFTAVYGVTEFSTIHHIYNSADMVILFKTGQRSGFLQGYDAQENSFFFYVAHATYSGRPTTVRYCCTVDSEGKTVWTKQQEYISQKLIDNSNKLAYSLISGAPTNLSEFNNDIGYLTAHQDISGKANIDDIYINGIYNGVIGDGETDDSAAIQALLDMVSRKDGDPAGTIFLPNRTYYIGTTLIINHGVNFICDGKIVYNGTDSAILMKGRFCNINIKKISAPNGTGIEMIGGEILSESNIVHVGFIKRAKRGLYLHTDSNYAGALSVNYITIDRIYGTGSEDSVGIEVCANNRYISEIHYKIGWISTFQIGVYIHSTDTSNENASSNRFHALHIEGINSSGRGILLENTSTNTFENVRIDEGYGEYAIEYAGKCAKNIINIDFYRPSMICINNATHCAQNLINTPTATGFGSYAGVKMIEITGNENPVIVPHSGMFCATCGSTQYHTIYNIYKYTNMGIFCRTSDGKIGVLQGFDEAANICYFTVITTTRDGKPTINRVDCIYYPEEDVSRWITRPNFTSQKEITSDNKLAYSLISGAPTNVSTFNNDANYQTEQQVSNLIANAGILPSVTISDNGKFLRVVNGEWVADTVPSAESEAY